MFLSIPETHHIDLMHEIIEETYFKEIKILGYVYFRKCQLYLCEMSITDTQLL